MSHNASLLPSSCLPSSRSLHPRIDSHRPRFPSSSVDSRLWAPGNTASHKPGVSRCSHGQCRIPDFPPFPHTRTRLLLSIFSLPPAVPSHSQPPPARRDRRSSHIVGTAPIQPRHSRTIGQNAPSGG